MTAELQFAGVYRTSARNVHFVGVAASDGSARLAATRRRRRFRSSISLGLLSRRSCEPVAGFSAVCPS